MNTRDRIEIEFETLPEVSDAKSALSTLRQIYTIVRDIEVETSGRARAIDCYRVRAKVCDVAGFIKTLVGNEKIDQGVDNAQLGMYTVDMDDSRLPDQI